MLCVCVVLFCVGNKVEFRNCVCLLQITNAKKFVSYLVLQMAIAEFYAE